MERVLVFENGKGQNTYKIKTHIKKSWFNSQT